MNTIELSAADAAAAGFGLRWQSAAATPLSIEREILELTTTFRAGESGVALRFPLQSKTVGDQPSSILHPPPSAAAASDS